ncbi:MAG: hypothetical protein KDK34_12365, partial [Leptospiraceae bacterium]|nr:hypothetical protein [Leptospiraceae bacterium]
MVWFAACLVLIAVVLSPIRVEASDQGHLYLENAIRAYTEKADPERAHFYLQLADRRGFTTPRDRADALQLKAYLYLYDSRQRDGMRTLGESLRYEPRAFPLYLLGLHALELRQFDGAYRMLADAALLEAPDGPPQSSNMDRAILYQLMPVYCPAETEAADGYRILNATRANQSPYTQPREFSALWRSQLRPAERRLAAYQALLLARILNDEPLDSELNRLRGIAATNDNDNPNSPVADAGNNPDPANAEDGLTALSDPLSGIMELLKDPLNDTYHRSCIQRLDRAEAFFRRRIQAGSIDEQYPALEYIRGHLKRAHFNRMVATRSPTSIYGYARYVQSRAMWYEALYNYRRALRMLEFDLPPTRENIASENSTNN